MTNRLASEKSPYLLQHKDNPVNWYPWSEEAFEAARREDKPIFLSIGCSTCHWCHVMAHESFEDSEVAKVLEDFICIKVDREERPDLEVKVFYVQGFRQAVFLSLYRSKLFYHIHSFLERIRRDGARCLCNQISFCIYKVCGR